MRRLGDLRVRRRVDEIMDGPGLDPRVHDRALRGLARLNRWSGVTDHFFPALRRLAERLRRAVSVLDVATGAGDLPIRLWRRARRRGIELKMAGCDVSVGAVAHARARAAEAGAAVDFFRMDALRDPIPDGFDVITAGLFLHHLESVDAVRLLRRMAASAGHLVLVSDLERSLAGMAVAKVAARVLTRSAVVRTDAERSVRAAFTRGELMRLAVRAGLDGAEVGRCWPFRLQLIWRRK